MKCFIIMGRCLELFTQKVFVAEIVVSFLDTGTQKTCENDSMAFENGDQIFTMSSNSGTKDV